MLWPQLDPLKTQRLSPLALLLSPFGAPAHLHKNLFPVRPIYPLLEMAVHAHRMGWRNSFETVLVCFLLVLVCTKAQEKDGRHDEFKDPTGNVNLAPFIQIRSAYECLHNVSSDPACDKYQLTYVGWANVTAPDTSSYCARCAGQARVVLNCISLVKHDLRFVDGTTVRDINYTISEGCAKEFTGKVLRLNDAGMMHASKVITFASALVAWLLIRSTHM